MRHSEDQVSALALNILMLETADKYFVEPLKQLARQKFEERAHAQWDQEEFGGIIAQIYDSNSPSVSTLKRIILEIVRQHSDVLFTNAAHCAFQQSARDTPEFLLDWSKEVAILIHRQKDLPTVASTWYKCPGIACAKYGGLFCVNNSAPASWHFSCPLRCSQDKDRAYWREHLLKR